MAKTTWGLGVILNATDKATPVLKKIGASFKSFFKSLNLGAGLLTTSMASLGFGAAMIGKMKRATKSASEFATAAAEVETIADPLEFARDSIEKLGTDLAVTYGKDAVGQVKALYQAVSAGASTYEDATGLMHAANKLAIGGVTETETAIDGLTTILNAYTEQELSAANVTDAMFTAIKAGKTTAGELSQHIGRAAASANSAGVSMEQTLSAIAAVTKKGINTGQAVSGIGAAFGNINKPTKEAAAEAKNLGIAFDAKTLRKKGFTQFLSDIVKSSKFTEDSMANLFGSIEAGRVMTALAAEGGKEYNAILEQMGNSAGATEEAFKVMGGEYDIAIGRLNEIKKAMERTFGSSLKRLAQPIINIFSGIADGIRKFVNALPPGVRDAIAGFFASFSGLLAGAGGLVVVVAGLSMFGVTLTGLLGALASFVALMGTATVLVGGLGTAFYAVYRAYKKNVGGLADMTGDLMTQLKLGYQGIIDIFQQGKISEGLMVELEKKENAGAAKFLAMFQRFLDRIKALWAGVKRGFEKGVDALAPAIERLKTHFGGMFDLFSSENTTEVLERWGAAGEVAGEKLASLGTYAIDMFIAISEWIKEFANSMENMTAKDLIDKITGFVEAFKGVWSTILEVKKGLDIVMRAIKFVAGLFETVGSAIGVVLAMIVKGAEILSRISLFDFKGAWRVFKETRKTGENKNAFRGIYEGGASMAGAITGKSVKAEAIMNMEEIIEHKKRARKARAEGNIEEWARLTVEIQRLGGNLEEFTKTVAKKPIVAEVAVKELARGSAMVSEAKAGRSLDEQPAATAG